MTIPWKTNKSPGSDQEFYVLKPREILPRRFVPFKYDVHSPLQTFFPASRPSNYPPRDEWHSPPKISRSGTPSPSPPYRKCRFPFTLSNLHQNELLSLITNVFTQSYRTRFNNQLLLCLLLLLDHLHLPPQPQRLGPRGGRYPI